MDMLMKSLNVGVDEDLVPVNGSKSDHVTTDGMSDVPLDKMMLITVLPKRLFLPLFLTLILAWLLLLVSRELD